MTRVDPLTGVLAKMDWAKFGLLGGLGDKGLDWVWFGFGFNKNRVRLVSLVTRTNFAIYQTSRTEL